MTRIAWWMVESLSRLLDGDEREVVRGDLAECGTSPAQALREMIGLVIRRQAVPWCDWRPWVMLASGVGYTTTLEETLPWIVSLGRENSNELELLASSTPPLDVS